MSVIVERLAVIGLGLIGGSLARALREAGTVGRIHAYDADPAQMREALALSVADACFETAAAAVADADLIVIAVPVLNTGAALRACLPGLAPGAIVCDVGSTKQSVLRAVAEVCGALPGWFVAAHPIAGTEKSGVAHSVATLFRGHRVIITPHEHQDTAAQTKVAAMWQTVGARVVEMAPARHDAIFAATSHLPHLIAYSFVDMLARQAQAGELFANAGGGFRDFTRIASSSPRMWHDIMRANVDSVASLLDAQIEELTQVRRLLAEERWDELMALFERARTARERHLSQIE